MRAVVARRSVESILGTLLLIALSLVVSGCGTPSTPTPAPPAPTPTPSQPLPFNPSRTNYVVPQHQYTSCADRAGPSEFGLGKRVERFSLNRFEPDCSGERDFSHQCSGFSDSEEPHFFHARVCRQRIRLLHLFKFDQYANLRRAWSTHHGSYGGRLEWLCLGDPDKCYGDVSVADRHQRHPKYARMAIVFRVLPHGISTCGTTLCRGAGYRCLDNDRGPIHSLDGWQISRVHHERANRIFEHAVLQSYCWRK